MFKKKGKRLLNGVPSRLCLFLKDNAYFIHITATTGYLQSIHSCGVTYEMFKSGFALFAYDLTTTQVSV